MVSFQSFANEFMKIAVEVRITPKAAAKAQAHFDAQDKDWKSFEKFLKQPGFRAALSKSELADPKLKKYVKTFGAYQGSKDEIAKIKSKDSGKTYTIKDLHTGRWGCNCGDWQFKHSINGGDCKHIRSVKKSKMVKAAGKLGYIPFGAGFSAAAKADSAKRKGIAAKRAVTQLNAPVY